jgi:hypothetical protein
MLRACPLGFSVPVPASTVIGAKGDHHTEQATELATESDRGEVLVMTADLSVASDFQLDACARLQRQRPCPDSRRLRRPAAAATPAGRRGDLALPHPCCLGGRRWPGGQFLRSLGAKSDPPGAA